MLPDRSVLIGQKLVENANMPKIQMRHFEHFFLNFRRLTLINLGHSTLVYTATFYGLGLVQSLAWRNHKRCKKARFCIRLLKVLGHGVELFLITWPLVMI